jgi:hypothetical protein
MRIFAWLYPLLIMTACYFPACFKWGHGRGLIAAGLGLVFLSAILSAILYVIPMIRGPSISLKGNNLQSGFRIPYLGHILAVIRRFIIQFGEVWFFLLLSIFMLLVIIGSILLSMKVYTSRDF